MKTGAELIAIERERQIKEEGWTSQHDDRMYANTHCLSMAAASYALPDHLRYDPKGSTMPTIGNQYLWPWESKWFKPSPEDRIKELTKAGALIAAEIDLLIRNQK